MKHLQSDEVHGLRRILRDQYSFQTIVKELIQNADDSQAGKFHIGWTDNWPQSIHPLLTGPTILILNDGIFRDADAEAIWRVNEPAKGEDLGAIGKYGLGMKSVFHLCEGFFYLASPDQPAADGRDFAELLTPWPRGGPHDDWSDLEAASRVLRERIASWSHGCTRWFCIAIPLRTPEHLNGAEAIIQGQFPTKEEFLQSQDMREFASWMPMLRNLRAITTWTWDLETVDFAEQVKLTSDPDVCSVRALRAHWRTTCLKRGLPRARCPSPKPPGDPSSIRSKSSTTVSVPCSWSTAGTWSAECRTGPSSEALWSRRRVRPSYRSSA